MKLLDLFEAPQLVKSELLPSSNRPFITLSALERRYSPVAHSHTDDGNPYAVFIRKDLTTAFIGIPGERKSDNEVGIVVLGTVEFRPPNLSGRKLIDLTEHKHVLQVALAHVIPQYQDQNWGLKLYASLASAGYIVISDNTQYLGGQALWKRIAKETLSDSYQVYIIDDGDVRLDTNGAPVTYDGSNISDAELWAEDTKHKYTLFMLKAL
jgi:hypothetical protein